MIASAKNIHRVKNFLDSDEIAQLLKFAESREEMSGPNVSSRAIFQLHPGLEIADIVHSYQARVQSLMVYTYGLDIVDLSGTAYRKWYPGERQDPHADCEAIFRWNYREWDLSPINNFSSIFIEYAALTYLNDEYEGGEIYFPEYGIEIKPEVGELIFFPGTHLYMHGVKEITSGNRHALMTFFTTPKLQYIWKYFVMDDSPLRVIERSAEQAMEEATKVGRSNIPKSLTMFGQTFPSKKKVKRSRSKFWQALQMAKEFYIRKKHRLLDESRRA